MLSALKRLGLLWISLSAVGSSLYLGLFLLGLRLPNLWNTLGSVAATSLGISILLLMDEPGTEFEGKEPKMTFAGLAYLLLTKRKPLLALLIFGILGSVILSYYVFSSVLTVEFTGESGLVVRLPGQIVRYYPIHPYGWQSTGIKLERGQLFEVEISGKVSPGYLQNINQQVVHLHQVLEWVEKGKRGASPPEPRLVSWPFLGPEGYPEAFYSSELAKGIKLPNYKEDNGLTVKGKPHNFVVGLLVELEEKPCPSEPSLGTPCVATPHEGGKPGRPGYDYDKNRDILVPLSPLEGEKHPIQRRAKRSGILWVAINDADQFRWDNSGLFFLKLTTR